VRGRIRQVQAAKAKACKSRGNSTTQSKQVQQDHLGT
jgi:hypothetical protein